MSRCRFASSIGALDPTAHLATSEIVADTVVNSMLEEPEDDDIVRWTRDGDSFVVLEVCALPREQTLPRG